MTVFKDRIEFLYKDTPKPAVIARELGMSRQGLIEYGMKAACRMQKH